MDGGERPAVLTVFDGSERGQHALGTVLERAPGMRPRVDEWLASGEQFLLLLTMPDGLVVTHARDADELPLLVAEIAAQALRLVGDRPLRLLAMVGDEALRQRLDRAWAAAGPAPTAAGRPPSAAGAVPAAWH